MQPIPILRFAVRYGTGPTDPTAIELGRAHQEAVADALCRDLRSRIQQAVLAGGFALAREATLFVAPVPDVITAADAEAAQRLGYLVDFARWPLPAPDSDPAAPGEATP